MNDIYDEVEEHSRAWLSSLDRTALGRFAVQSENLILAHALLTFSELRRGVPVEPWSHLPQGAKIVAQDEAYGYLNTAATALRLNVYQTDDNLLHVQGELAFWCEYRNSHSAVNTAPEEDDDAIDLWTEHLFQVAASPEFHDYFAIGIWDEMLITNCLRDDIDPELAKTLALS